MSEEKNKNLNDEDYVSLVDRWELDDNEPILITEKSE